jgi:hypothetical protein
MLRELNRLGGWLTGWLDELLGYNEVPDPDADDWMED